MTRIVIVGCGVVGATIAYELSKIAGLEITLIEQKTPASGSTGAALGVLMGAISQKTKGRAWRLRQESMRRYETLIPELEALTGHSIPFNRQGILKLLLPGEDLTKWQKLVDLRRGYHLEIWSLQRLQRQCPQLDTKKFIGAVYSADDRQVNPTILTQALVSGAAKNNVQFYFDVKVENVITTALADSNKYRSCHIQTSIGEFETDWLIIAAGLGSTPLTVAMNQAIDLRPVFGQALRIKLDDSFGNANFQPVITGNDVHIVPLNSAEYWVGATVEFTEDSQEYSVESALLEQVWQEAISFCPILAQAQIIDTWSGKRPRPEKRSAPIIDRLSGYSNVLLATGHYRNGVLLAPGTAQEIINFLSKST